MPRACRYVVEGHTYHLTHRCHDRRFLLKFSQERDAYREWIRIGSQRYGVPVYGYCVTHNHTHIIVHATDPRAVGALMQLPSGSVARQLNRRKRHEGSVWEHPYQCTMIEDGQHLLNCLRYVDLNMVWCGAVAHPKEWRWCGYDELVGTRKRYRLVDVDRLLQSLELGSHAELARMYSDGILDQIQRRELTRSPHWTEALAVGSVEFVESAMANYRQRVQFDVQSSPDGKTWLVKEAMAAYTADSEAESAP